MTLYRSGSPNTKSVEKCIRDKDGRTISEVLSCGHSINLKELRLKSGKTERRCPTCIAANPNANRRKHGGFKA